MISNSDCNATPIFFTFPPQMFQSFTQNPITNNSGDGEFLRFKSIFEDERITVDQIYDLTDTEFDQLGINKIGWRKAFRAAAQRYK